VIKPVFFLVNRKMHPMSCNIQESIRKIQVLKNIPQEVMADLVGRSQSSYGELERAATQLNMHRSEQLPEIFEMRSVNSTSKSIFRRQEQRQE
jgi:hypothetical protein